MALTIREFLRERTYTRLQVDKFLDPNQPNWATFDSQLGYRLRSYNIIRDGVDSCRTFVNLETTGERKMINFSNQPCRINTYGNSFTQGVQTSDGETWQETMAAHFGEPVRNRGVGGYGVYQAYLRMLMEEVGSSSAKYVMLNIWSVDDHMRSLDAWRYLRVINFFKSPENVNMFHANPWAHVRVDLESGSFFEVDNPFSSPESLYRLCDEDYVYSTFKDDVIVQLCVAKQGGEDVDFNKLKRLAEVLQVEVDFSTSKSCQESAMKLHIVYGLRASMFILEKAQNFIKSQNKKLLVLLSYAASIVIECCKNKPRIDQLFVQFLKDKRIPYVDGLEKHVEDYKAFSLPPEEYVKRYYITPHWGHYNPTGNHFFAFAVKDAVVDWLDPKPVAYREGSETM